MSDHIDWLTQACREGTSMAELIERVRLAGQEVRDLQARIDAADTKRISDLEWNRSMHEQRLEEVRESHRQWRERMDRTREVTHRIGQAVLEAKQHGRKTVRIADIVADDERLGPHA